MEAPRGVERTTPARQALAGCRASERGPALVDQDKHKDKMSDNSMQAQAGGKRWGGTDACLERGGPTLTHPEPVRETPQRRGYCLLQVGA